MLVITAEVWPGGDEDLRFTIGQITASNESLLAPVSRYSVTISQKPYDRAGVRGWSQEFEVSGHHRSQGAWPLVFAILQTATGNLKSD